MTGVAVNGYLGVFIKATATNEGREKKLDEQKKQSDDKECRVERQRKIITVTSGQLTSNNHFGPEISDKEQLKEEEEEWKATGAARKREAQQQKDSNKFDTAYRKYTNNEPLLADNLNVPITRVKAKDEIPLHTKITDLRSRWDRRKHGLT
jgi:hypothetical protein